MSSENHVKIHVTFPHDNENDPAGENLWAIKMDKPDHFKVDNHPFHAYGICYGDVVRCEEKNGFPHEVIEVVERAPSTLLRVYFTVEDEETYIGMLKGMTDKFGTRWERARANFFAISVSDENFDDFCDELVRLQGLELLDFETCFQQEEGHFGPGLDDDDDDQ